MNSDQIRNSGVPRIAAGVFLGNAGCFVALLVVWFTLTLLGVGLLGGLLDFGEDREVPTQRERPRR